jgi:predicted metalloprotease with PDZ domain
MPTPNTHLFHVTVTISNNTNALLDVALPVWTPGSYMVRDYARHMQEFAVADNHGQPLAWRKHDKTTWRIDATGAAQIIISYKVYAFELTVRTSHLDASHGYFNPATLCLYLPDRQNESHTICVVTPPTWRVSTGLPLLSSEPTEHEQCAWTFRAANYDEIVDAPFECGTHRLLTFSVNDIPHEIAIWGHGNENEAQLLDDTRRIVETTAAIFGSLPYQRYLFIFHLADGYGGLEHRNSVTNLVDRWNFQPRTTYENRVLALTSHEFFHVWNIKRIRPAPLGPFDYSRENYTRQLWVAEGITSYYDNLLLRRAGLISARRYLEMVADDIRQLQSQPGRLLQSLEQSSFDAWIKFYRPDENSPNSAISYYQKGGLVALLLDLHLRQHSGGTRSLDDVLRLLNADADGSGFDEDHGFQRAAEQVLGTSLNDFFQHNIKQAGELDYNHYLNLVGLTLQWSHSQPNTNWLGITTRSEQGRLKVVSVRSDGPAYAAGIYANDEIIALDGWRIDTERLDARLSERPPGSSVRLVLFRREQLHEIDVVVTAAPPDRVAIVAIEAPTIEQHALRRQWIGELD